MKELVSLDDAAVLRMRKAIDSDSEMLIWVGDWLSHLNLFSDAQVYEILRFVKSEVTRFEEEVNSGVNRQIATLVVCDYRWISFSGIPMFLDTQTSEIVEDLGEYAVTHIMCDLAALRLRMRYRQGRFNAPGINHNSAEPDKAGQQSTQQSSTEDDSSNDASV